MATVGNFVCPIFQERISGQPVTLETCYHTFSKDSIATLATTKMKDRIGKWDLRIPDKYACPLCKESGEFGLDDVVINDEWQRIETVLGRWREAFPKVKESGVKLTEILKWDTKIRFEKIKSDWQMRHPMEAFQDITVEDFLKDKDDLVVKELWGKYLEEHPSMTSEFLPLVDLFQWAIESLDEKDMELFRDVRPLHLLGYTEDNHDSEKIKAAPSRTLAFSEKERTYPESLHFIATSTYHFTMALFAEIGLYLLYFWECGLITKDQYNDLRSTYVINRLTPIYLKYMELPPEPPKD